SRNAVPAAGAAVASSVEASGRTSVARATSRNTASSAPSHSRRRATSTMVRLTTTNTRTPLRRDRGNEPPRYLVVMVMCCNMLRAVLQGDLPMMMMMIWIALNGRSTVR
ncbi:unnamed protein product, partial [Ectocarpus fasciculatus]